MITKFIWLTHSLNMNSFVSYTQKILGTWIIVSLYNDANYHICRYIMSYSKTTCLKFFVLTHFWCKILLCSSILFSSFLQDWLLNRKTYWDGTNAVFSGFRSTRYCAVKFISVKPYGILEHSQFCFLNEVLWFHAYLDRINTTAYIGERNVTIRWSD